MSADPTAGLELSRAPRSKLADVVARQLLEEIEAKRLAPGTRLPSERDLQVALGVGRSTIREAINGLSMMGLVEIRHGSGAFVADRAARPGAERLVAELCRAADPELLEARRVAAVEAARLAAARATAADRRALQDALDRHARLVAAGEPAAAASAAFRQALADAAGNAVLASLLAALGDALAPALARLDATAGFGAWEAAQHRGLLDAVAGGDATAAARRMRAYADAVTSRLGA
ncbi:MAG TPA: winged helix-turn-helix domain-containing protein [Baekduia sp.]|uniref:FadR/GntR family transcriptional regulator n=1 Tax=Baekduia sp. TaxID=2600305 RepID=UPI002D78E63E|nr:winged helix-turn-helix domain-containing protein [Baekduia sp.]HET6507059.1 winged helix-turn-helix domain-containing protein [Baekduia sp.]